MPYAYAYRESGWVLANLCVPLSVRVCIATVWLLKEELQLLQEPGSHIGEVVKQMSTEKVLVKVWMAIYIYREMYCLIWSYFLFDIVRTGRPRRKICR